MADQTTTLTGNPSAQFDLAEDLTSRLIDLVWDIDFAALPGDVQRHARHSLADTLGVQALGSVTEPVQMLRRVVLTGQPDGATVIGPEPVRTDPLTAAMINGLAGHIRDFDDAGAGGHVSAIIVPVTLALAEVQDASGADVLAAMVSGYETAFRINRLVTMSSYYLGFHSSGTVGTFGAAAAACRLLGLSREQWAMAFGIAGSLASGLIANFGSMTKPLHTANAARAGILAARLAQEGFTGSAHILEHELGFVRTHTPDVDAEAALAPLGEPWALETMMYKFNAACTGTHSGADGTRRLLREHNLTADDVAAMTLRVPKIQTEVANIQWPQTVEQAKFSIRFVAAAGLLGINTAEAFPEQDSEITDPAVQSAIGLIEVRPLDGINHGGRTDIEMRLTNGQTVSGSFDSSLPMTDLDAEQAKISDKFRHTAITLWKPATVDTALTRLLAFENERSVRAFLTDLTTADA
jgi:2-methylcitrate dehydratase PrpD